MSRERWLIYALGSGMGHVTRAASLARIAIRRGNQISLFVNSPIANKLPLQRELPGAEVVFFDPQQKLEEHTAALLDAVQSREFDVLVVDTFPRGLVGEFAKRLPSFTCAKVFVHRDLNRDYVEKFALREFAAAYDLILSPGETGPLRETPHFNNTAFESTCAWLMRDDCELLSTGDARTALYLQSPHDDGLPVVGVFASGKPAEIAEMDAMASRLTVELKNAAAVRLFSPVRSRGDAHSIEHWPALELFRGIDLVIGAGGYNTVHECRATQTPLFAFARERLYDDQSRRLAKSETVTNFEQMLNATRLKLERIKGTREEVLTYENGVHRAVEFIEQL